MNVETWPKSRKNKKIKTGSSLLLKIFGDLRQHLFIHVFDLVVHLSRFHHLQISLQIPSNNQIKLQVVCLKQFELHAFQMRLSKLRTVQRRVKPVFIFLVL